MILLNLYRIYIVSSLTYLKFKMLLDQFSVRWELHQNGNIDSIKGSSVTNFFYAMLDNVEMI